MCCCVAIITFFWESNLVCMVVRSLQFVPAFLCFVVGGSPDHYTNTILVGEPANASHSQSRIVMGLTIRWLSKAIRGREFGQEGEVHW